MSGIAGGRGRGRRLIAPVLGVGLGIAIACRPPGLDPGAERLLLAPTTEFLAARAHLVQQGALEEARALWAARVLLEPDSTGTLEHHWASMLAAATRRGVPGDAMAAYRLARTFQDVRWYPEALASARRALELDPDLAVARQLETTLAHLERFATAVDSVTRLVHARALAGEPVARELPRLVALVSATHEITPETLRRRGLYLGRRAPAGDTGIWEVELSVIVAYAPEREIRRPDGSMRLRRVLVDHNRLPVLPGVWRHPWRIEPGKLGRGDRLVLHHPRDAYRRGAVLLYRELERRGGIPPARVDELTVDPAGRVATVVASEEAETLHRVADCLRLRAAAPYLAAARARQPDRVMPGFVRAFTSDWIEQIELGETRLYLDLLPRDGEFDAVALETRRVIEGLRHGPLPFWELASLIETTAGAETDTPRTEAARALVDFLRRDTGVREPDDWLRLDPEQLRRSVEQFAVRGVDWG